MTLDPGEKVKPRANDVIKDRIWNLEATGVRNVDKERDLLLSSSSIKYTQQLRHHIVWSIHEI